MPSNPFPYGVHYAASTGPLRIRSGNQIGANVGACMTNASTGPLRIRSGNPAQLFSGARGLNAASTGPLRIRSGNLTSGAVGAANDGGFNGAAPNSERKFEAPWLRHG